MYSPSSAQFGLPPPKSCEDFVEVVFDRLEGFLGTASAAAVVRERTPSGSGRGNPGRRTGLAESRGAFEFLRCSSADVTGPMGASFASSTGSDRRDRADLRGAPSVLSSASGVALEFAGACLSLALQAHAKIDSRFADGESSALALLLLGRFRSLQRAVATSRAASFALSVRWLHVSVSMSEECAACSSFLAREVCNEMRAFV